MSLHDYMSVEADAAHNFACENEIRVQELIGMGDRVGAAYKRNQMNKKFEGDEDAIRMSLLGYDGYYD